MSKIEVNLKEKSYPIFIQEGLFNDIGKLIRDISKSKNAAIVTDSNVNSYYGEILKNKLKEEGFNVSIIEVTPGEESKSLQTLEKVYNSLLDAKITRKDIIIALGGGVIGDLAGFAAATFLRGISFIQIPTSLLAQVDSSVGGKVAVNLSRGKNLVGNFYHPDAVYIDPKMLSTLKEKYFIDGMAEVIKYGCIKDKDLFQKLQSYDRKQLLDNISNIIFRCIEIKRDIVEKDEKDKGDRMLLNFGHTIGHAVEKCFNFNTYSHGEAVAIGMYHITRNSEREGITKEGTTDVIKNILMKYSLPFTADVENEKIVKAAALDKKSEGEYINLIVLKEIGTGYIHKVSRDKAKDYLNI